MDIIIKDALVTRFFHLLLAPFPNSLAQVLLQFTYINVLFVGFELQMKLRCNVARESSRRRWRRRLEKSFTALRV